MNNYYHNFKLKTKRQINQFMIEFKKHQNFKNNIKIYKH